MKDIAAAVGVSVVSVSNALAGRKGVSDDVRFRVEKAARELGYDMKKNDRSSQGMVIGVLAPEKYITVGQSFYWALYQRVAYEAAKSHEGFLCKEDRRNCGRACCASGFSDERRAVRRRNVQ